MLQTEEPQHVCAHVEDARVYQLHRPARAQCPYSTLLRQPCASRAREAGCKAGTHLPSMARLGRASLYWVALLVSELTVSQVAGGRDTPGARERKAAVCGCSGRLSFHAVACVFNQCRCMLSAQLLAWPYGPLHSPLCEGNCSD